MKHIIPVRRWTNDGGRHPITGRPDVPPPPCVSYANVHNYYGPYAYCNLDKGVACTQHIQLPTHTCARELVQKRGI